MCVWRNRRNMVSTKWHEEQKCIMRFSTLFMWGKAICMISMQTHITPTHKQGAHSQIRHRTNAQLPIVWFPHSHTHAHTHAHTHTHTHTHTQSHTHTHTHNTHTHTHTHTHTTHTHTHSHTHMSFLWKVGTSHRRNGFYTVQTVCAIALHLPYT